MRKLNYLILLSVVFLLLGLVAMFFYRRPIKKIALKKYKEIYGNKHNPEKVATPLNRDFVWGVDISHHQKSINWNILVEENKPDFIFLKVSEGASHVDTKYKDYSSKSRKYNIPIGGYHFFTYQVSGKSQAQNFIRNADLKSGDLYPVLDVEFRKKMNSPSWIRKEIKSYCEEIKKEYGVYPIIYCECDYYKKYLNSYFSNYKYWISNLYREPQCEYIIWQYTDDGLVKGIGNIDNNRLNSNIGIKDITLRLVQ